MQSATSLADWIVTVATVGAILIAAWELRASSRNAGQTHAREAWMQYLSLGLQNPELGATNFTIDHFKMKSVNELIEGNSIESERYLWFLDIMMEACESLINYFPTDIWKNTIKFNIRLHKGAIEALWTNERNFYSAELGKIIEEVLAE